MTASEGVKFVFPALQHLFCAQTIFSFSPLLKVSSETIHHLFQCYMLSILTLIKYSIMIKIITFYETIQSNCFKASSNKKVIEANIFPSRKR